MTQNEALRILQTGANAFLTGEPGSGKTHTVNAYVRWLRSHGIEPAITASTGIAATHVGGMTIHAWSGIGIRDHLSAADVDAIASKEHVVRRIAKASVLIIDEISMLSGDVLGMVDQVLREVRRNESPFGGIQVVLVGDFFQLPPIGRGGREVPFAFESEVWKRLNPLTLYLDEQHRQDDPAFTGLLSRIRSGTADADDVSTIVSREAEEEEGSDLPRLYTHNADADRINAQKLAALPSSAACFSMDATGPDALVEALKRGCLSPEKLELKQGAVVMCTKNNPIAGYSNGTVGTIVGFESGTAYPLVETRDGRHLAIAPQEWAIEENGKVRAKLSQVPLRLAWAITIHKSQGQSIDAAMVDLSRAFEYGQGYVALSRLRSLDGLHLLGWHENALAIHPAVAEKDKEFRESSAAAVRAFASLEEAGERKSMEDNFIRAAGGSLEASADGGRQAKPSTYQATMMLAAEGKPLGLIAKERGMTVGTIVTHFEKLHQMGEMTLDQVAELSPKKVLDSLDAIGDAFQKAKTTSLTPVFKKFKGKYTFDELKLARLLLSDS